MSLNSKTELYELVEALRRNGATSAQTAELLGCSEETIRTILITLGIKRRRSIAEILQTLDADLQRRIRIWENPRRQQQAQHQSA